MEELFKFNLNYEWLNINFISNNEEAMTLIFEQYSDYVTTKLEENDTDLKIYSFLVDSVDKYYGENIMPFNDLETSQKLLSKGRIYYHYYEKGIYSYRYLLRIVNRLLESHAVDKNMYVLHASSVEILGHGLVIIGKKGVGKTTLACILAKYANGKLVSNDKTIITTDKKIICIPDLVSITKESLNKLNLELPNNSNACLDIKNNIYNKYKLTYKYLKDIYKIKVKNIAKLSVAIEPRLVEGDKISITTDANINDYIIKAQNNKKIKTLSYSINIGVNCTNDRIINEITRLLNSSYIYQ